MQSMSTTTGIGEKNFSWNFLPENTDLMQLKCFTGMYWFNNNFQMGICLTISFQTGQNFTYRTVSTMWLKWNGLTFSKRNVSKHFILKRIQSLLLHVPFSKQSKLSNKTNKTSPVITHKNVVYSGNTNWAINIAIRNNYSELILQSVVLFTVKMDVIQLYIAFYLLNPCQMLELLKQSYYLERHSNFIHPLKVCWEKSQHFISVKRQYLFWRKSQNSNDVSW